MRSKNPRFAVLPDRRTRRFKRTASTSVIALSAPLPDAHRHNAYIVATRAMASTDPGVRSSAKHSRFSHNTSVKPLWGAWPPQEVAKAFAFLASPAANFATSTNLLVGGLTQDLQIRCGKDAGYAYVSPVRVADCNTTFLPLAKIG
jgi:hypothetical protein